MNLHEQEVKMVQVRGIKGQVYLKFNDPQQLEDTTKGTFKW
jgi:hypothetical protein